MVGDGIDVLGAGTVVAGGIVVVVVVVDVDVVSCDGRITDAG